MERLYYSAIIKSLVNRGVMKDLEPQPQRGIAMMCCVVSCYCQQVLAATSSITRQQRKFERDSGVKKGFQCSKESIMLRL